MLYSEYTIFKFLLCVPRFGFNYSQSTFSIRLNLSELLLLLSPVLRLVCIRHHSVCYIEYPICVSTIFHGVCKFLVYPDFCGCILIPLNIYAYKFYGVHMSVVYSNNTPRNRKGPKKTKSI